MSKCRIYSSIPVVSKYYGLWCTIHHIARKIQAFLPGLVCISSCLPHLWEKHFSQLLCWKCRIILYHYPHILSSFWQWSNSGQYLWLPLHLIHSYSTISFLSWFPLNSFTVYGALLVSVYPSTIPCSCISPLEYIFYLLLDIDLLIFSLVLKLWSRYSFPDFIM